MHEYEYVVLTADDPDEINEVINDYARRGYRLMGPIQTTCVRHNEGYQQHDEMLTYTATMETLVNLNRKRNSLMADTIIKQFDPDDPTAGSTMGIKVPEGFAIKVDCPDDESCNGFSESVGSELHVHDAKATIEIIPTRSDD